MGVDPVGQVDGGRPFQAIHPPGGDPLGRRQHGGRVVDQVAGGHGEAERGAMGQRDDQGSGCRTDPTADRGGQTNHSSTSGHLVPQVAARVYQG